MATQNRLLLISNIENFIFSLMPMAIKESKKYNMNEEEIDFFFDWSINQILMDVFSLRVIHHYRHDVYLCMYSVMSYELIQAFKRSVNIQDLRMLKGCEIKTLVNGYDLIITRRIKQYINYK